MDTDKRVDSREEVDGVAPRNRTGVRRYHRAVGHRAMVDKFDGVTEQPASDAGRVTDDCREKSSGRLEQQRSL